MERTLIEEMVSTNMSIGGMSNNTGKSKATIRYWLKVYNLKTLNPNMKAGERYPSSNNKKCPKCKIEKEKDLFYNKRNKSDFSTYCKECTKQDVFDRQRKLKQQCVDYKGGKCSECGYNKCIGALDFHHLDPNKKDFSIGKKAINSFSDIIKKELDKCILLCANCHREKHYLYPNSHY